MLKNWSFGIKVSLVLSVISMSSVALIEGRNVWSEISRIQAEQDDAEKEVTRQIQVGLTALSDQAETVAQSLAFDETLMAFWAAGDRDGLMAAVDSRFQQFKSNASVGQIVLQIPPATPFLRVQRPDRFGDDISSARPDVVRANQQRQSQKGLASGKLSGLGVRAQVPAYSQGQFLGVVDVGLNLDDRMIDGLLADLSSDLNVTMTLGAFVDDGYRVVVGDDQDFDSKGLDAVKNGEIRILEKADHQLKLVPIQDIVGRSIGFIALKTDDSIMQAAISDRLVQSGIHLVLALIASIVVGVMIGRKLARPLENVTQVIGKLAEGDLKIALPGHGNGPEIDRICAAMERLKDGEATRRDLESAQIERTKRLEDRICSFDAQIQKLLEELHHAGDELGTVAGSMRDATGSTMTTIESVAAASVQMSSTISEIADTTNKSREMVNQSVGEVTLVRKVMNQMDDCVSEVGKITALIAEIAEQTNLLALNATIEAARAGDQGRGFAVVASEVKALAGRTAQATEEINDKISRIGSIAGQASEKIQQMADAVNQADTAAMSIASAVEEQAATTSSIDGSVQHAASLSRNLVENIGEAGSTDAKSLVGSTRIVNDAVDRISGEIEEFLKEVRVA